MLTPASPPAAPLPDYPSLLGSSRTALLHLLLLAGLYSALYCFGLLDSWPDEHTLITWDAGIFRAIAERGYPDAAQGDNAFFPLMPMIWRLAGFGPVGISVFNGLCASVGVVVVARTFRLRLAQQLLVHAAPLMMFTLVPYAEGLLFLFASLLVRGLHQQHLTLTLIGLAGCSLTRSAATLFVPAFLFAELLQAAMAGGAWRLAFRNLLLGFAVMAAALASVMWFQARQHGDWWAFYKVHALWQHELNWPLLPFSTSAGINMTWLDGFALLLALASLVACLVLGLRWLRYLWRRQPLPLVSKAVLFACGYSAGAGFFCVFYQAGDIVGVSRYILATPFFAVLMWQLWHWEIADWKLLAGVLLGCGVVAGLLGFPGRVLNLYPGEAYWYFGLFTAYVVTTVMAPRYRWAAARELAGGLYVVNLLFLVYLLSIFINGAWVN